MNASREAYVKWMGVAGLMFNQGISKHSHAAALRPMPGAKPPTQPSEFECELRMWAARRHPEVEGKAKHACAMMREFPDWIDYDQDHAHASAAVATIALGRPVSDPDFESWRPFMVADHSSGADYGVEQCVAWADEFAWLSDWDTVHRTYDLGLVSIVLRDMFAGKPHDGMLMYVNMDCLTPQAHRRITAHASDPVYTRDVLVEIVERCEQLAAVLGTGPPHLKPHYETETMHYFTYLDPSEEPILFAGENVLYDQVSSLKGNLYSTAQSATPQLLPPAPGLQPACGGGTFVPNGQPLPSDGVPGHPLASADPYLVWQALELHSLRDSIPDEVIACAVKPAELLESSDTKCAGLVRVWVTKLDANTYAWISQLVRRRSLGAPVDDVVGSPAEDPAIEDWRPLMLLDRSADPEVYGKTHVERHCEVPRPENCAGSPVLAYRDAGQCWTSTAITWLAGRGFEWFPGLWVVLQITDDGFIIHINPGCAARGVDAQVAAFEDRCRELLDLFCTYPVAVSVEVSTSLTIPPQAWDHGWVLMYFTPNTHPEPDEPDPLETEVTWCDVP